MHLGYVGSRYHDILSVTIFEQNFFLLVKQQQQDYSISPLFFNYYYYLTFFLINLRSPLKKHGDVFHLKRQLL